jgi:hypothetical protein
MTENGFPDVVGTAEAAELLGVERPRITRYRRADRMPPLAADLAATPVWHRDDVEKMRDDPNAVFGAARPLDIVGTSEVAALFDVDKSQVGRWRRGGDFPGPDAQLAAGPLWWRKRVRSWRPPSKRR